MGAGKEYNGIPNVDSPKCKNLVPMQTPLKQGHLTNQDWFQQCQHGHCSQYDPMLKVVPTACQHGQYDPRLSYAEGGSNSVSMASMTLGSAMLKVLIVKQYSLGMYLTDCRFGHSEEGVA